MWWTLACAPLAHCEVKDAWGKTPCPSSRAPASSDNLNLKLAQVDELNSYRSPPALIL